MTDTFTNKYGETFKKVALKSLKRGDEWSATATVYDIHDAAAHASFPLGRAFGRYMSRLDKELNR